MWIVFNKNTGVLTVNRPAGITEDTSVTCSLTSFQNETSDKVNVKITATVPKPPPKPTVSQCKLDGKNFPFEGKVIDGVAQLNNIRVVFKKDGSSVDKSFEEGCPGDELEVKCDDAKHTPFV